MPERRTQDLWSHYKHVVFLIVLCILLNTEEAQGLKSRRLGLKGRRSRGLNGGSTVDNPPAIPRRRKMDQGPMEKLNMWIDGDEIEEFVGVPMDIFVIRESVVVPYIQDAYFDHQLPVLPPHVDLVSLTWQAKDGEYPYQFTDLRSLDPKTLYDPLLSIPQTGNVPRIRSSFEMAIPCTGKVTGIASMYIVLHIQNSHHMVIPGSPLKLHLRKRCIAFDSRSICPHDCENGGECNASGQCECTSGYYGDRCELAVCFPECRNNGTCISPRTCACAPGWSGSSCEIPICLSSCLHNGYCIEPEMCACTNNYYGNYCQHHTGSCEIPCKNGGTCTMDNSCTCVEGYQGQFCQKPICQRSCGVHGRCVGVDQCECLRGWRGRYCHKTMNKSKNRKLERRMKRKQQAIDNMMSSGRWTPTSQSSSGGTKKSRKNRRLRDGAIRNRRHRQRQHRQARRTAAQ